MFPVWPFDQESEGLPPGAERMLMVAAPVQSPKQLLFDTTGGDIAIEDCGGTFTSCVDVHDPLL
jgi:hypothetical protein